MKAFLKVFGLSLLFLGPVQFSDADIAVPGADGSDGALNCGTLQGNPDYPCGVPCATGGTYTIDLSTAASRDWNIPSPVRGKGVYDYQKWAVVYKYSCVDIPANVTINFKNHPSHAPVVWLVSGNVAIFGNVVLDGKTQQPGLAEPGPGGFRGGKDYLSPDSPQGAGFGPGGGRFPAGEASYGGKSSTGEPTYGNSQILPLIGGSGGSGYTGPVSVSGGGGGGAILIATRQTFRITTPGGVFARGLTNSAYRGSGGAIRIIADAVDGTGRLEAGHTESSGTGRIRVEANRITLEHPGDPRYTIGSLGDTAVLWPSDLGNAPSVRVVSVGGQIAPTDPRASLDFPGADVTVPSGGAQLVVIDAQYVPLDWSVGVRAVPIQGPDMLIPAAFAGGDATHSTWQATLPLGSGFSVLQARASKPTATATAGETEEDVDAENPNVEPE